jgi:hypothetical protein
MESLSESGSNFVDIWLFCRFYVFLSVREYLKVVGNEKGGGVKEQATVRIWFRTMAIDVCLIFSVAVVFSSTYFRFLFVKLG